MLTKIDSFNKKYNQKVYVEDFLNSPEKFISHKTYLSDLRLLAIYLRDYKNLKPLQRLQYLESFCEQYCEEYDRVVWINIIAKALNYSKKSEQRLKVFDPPCIYDYEFEYINGLDIPETHKKILFCVLAFYKYELRRRKNENKDNFYIPNFVLSPVDLKKYSGIKLSKNEDVAYIHDELDKKGLLGYSPKSNGQVIALFVKNIEKKESKDFIKVVNLKNCGLFYEYFLNKERMKFCKKCGDIFKVKSNSQLYCKDCLNEENPKTKIVKCDYCGNPFIVKSKNNRSNLCEKCYKQHRLEQQKNYRENKK